MRQSFSWLSGLLLVPLLLGAWGQDAVFQIGSTVTEANRALQAARAPRQAARAENTLQALVETYLHAHARAAPALPPAPKR